MNELWNGRKKRKKKPNNALNKTKKNPFRWSGEGQEMNNRNNETTTAEEKKSERKEKVRKRGGGG